MDWDELESATRRLLDTLLRYSYPMDPETMFAMANESMGNWRQSDAIVQSNYRALDLMEVLGLVARPDGYTRELTARGRNAAVHGSRILPTSIDEDPRVYAWLEREQLRSAITRPSLDLANSFRRLEIADWRQFEQVSIDFHPRLTVITGANGAGKTTLLSALAPHFSWNAQLISSLPERRGTEPYSGYRKVGDLFYTSGGRTEVHHAAPAGVQSGGVTMTSQQQVPGIYISSHRSISSYQPLQTLPARFSSANVLLEQFASEVQTRYLGQSGQYPPLFRMKEALVSAALYGYGNQAVAQNDEAREIWEGFQDVLGRLLPPSLGFRRLEVDDGVVMLRTQADSFPLEAVSGGVSALLELGWQIFLRGRESASFTVCIDEPENHLHPEMQRSIVPSLLQAFPLASFVIATHSPFVVTATTDCSVYSLLPSVRGKVASRAVENINSSGTSDETLMAVLGLATTLPIWAEERIREALRKLPATPSAEDLRSLRSSLVEAGLGDQFPAAVGAIRDRG